MSETPIHQAFWLLRQLHKGKSNPEHFINFRCVHNGKPHLDSITGKSVAPSEVTYDEFIKVRDFEDAWLARLCNVLHTENSSITKPSNIYFAINPTTTKSHKKDAFAGFVCFYLDLDSNKGYTKEQRAAQIHFWEKLGFKPSITVDSGHGYHVYWILTRVIDREAGERTLKRMVALAGCREGGNTFDISRVFRLPGFRNVKEWFKDDCPPCGIVYPEYDPTSTPNIDAKQYEFEKFAHFPPSSLEDLSRFYNEARRLSANDPNSFDEKVSLVLAGAAQRQQELEATLAGSAVAAQNQSQSQVEPTLDEHGDFIPKLNTVPPPNDIKFARNESWIKKYCQRGHAGLNQGEIDDLKMKLNIEDASASELDFRVMYALAKKGYTKEAVRAFWLRPDVKLHRPDKEAKNANYFDMSYDKALEYVKAAKKQNTENGESKGPKNIVVSQHQTIFTDGESTSLVLSAELRLNAIYVDQDGMLPCDREIYDVDAVYVDPNEPDGTHVLNMLLPRTAFNSIVEFKKHCSDMLCCMSDKNSELQHLLKFLKYMYRNAPVHKFHSKMSFADDHFVFPTYAIYADKIVQSEQDQVTKKMLKQIPMFNAFTAEFKSDALAEAFLSEHWSDILRCHLPRVVASTLGFIAVSAVAQIFRKTLCIDQFHVPTVNIRGGSSTAKSETVKYLCSLAGLKPGSNVVGTSSSEFAITQYLGSSDFLPIIIDEFKFDGQNEKNLAVIRSLFRRMYSGEAVIKGRRDLSVVSTTLHTAMIVIGEHPLERIGDISEISRMLPIDTDEYKPSNGDNFERWSRLSGKHMYLLGPKFYQWMLQQSPQELYRKFEMVLAEVTVTVSDHFGGERFRIAHNLAAVWFGCRLIDEFVKSIYADAPTIEHVCNPKRHLVKYLCDWSEITGQTLKVKKLTLNPETNQMEEHMEVVANNETLVMLKSYGMMLEAHDKIIRDLEAANVMVYHEDEKTERLFIHFPTMFNAYTMYCNTYHRGPIPPENKIKAMLRAAEQSHEPWIVTHTRVIKVKGLAYRCAVFDARALRQMNVWPAKALLSNVPSGDTPIDLPDSEAPSTPPHENSAPQTPEVPPSAQPETSSGGIPTIF